VSRRCRAFSSLQVLTNAATFCTRGLKGRFREDVIKDDHTLQDATYPVLEVGMDDLSSGKSGHAHGVGRESA
jgi:hypothetical protein